MQRSNALAILLALVLAGCSTAQLTPASGPTRADIATESRPTSPAGAAIQVVTIDHEVVRRLNSRERPLPMAEALRLQSVADGSAARAVKTDTGTIGAGDQLEISLWEAPPALLFGAPGSGDLRGAPAGRALTLPEQMVDGDGQVSVPFVGRIQAAGRSASQLQDSIVRGLNGKANQAQALVRVTRPNTATVTVVGDVANSLRLPLSPRGERLLDALAAAGGVRQPISKVSIQLTRKGQTFSVPLDTLIRDPQQNVALQTDDVITALLQPQNFSVLGATGRNEELPLEAQGISLAQALARAGGLNDNRADARGVFIFRLEDPAVVGVSSAQAVTADGKVPVIYLLDLRDPASFFVAQGFTIAHRDVLYVANAPGAELQKFLNLLWGAALPALNVLNLTR